MKEINEINFTRRLAVEEMTRYTFISHYTVVRPEKKSPPIRIVFNSLAMYECHQLNDYWLKGPGLLNILFGINLCFVGDISKEMALVGDISKM